LKRRNPSATTRIRENRGRGIYDRAVAFLLTLLALLIPLKFGVPNLDVSTPTVPDDVLGIGGHLASLFRALFSLDLRGALKTVAGVLTTPWPEEIAEILILLAFFLWGMKCLSERSLVLRVGKVDAAMWLFVLAGVVATLLSPGFHSSMVILKQFVSYALLYFLVVHALETPAQQGRILKCFLISTAIVALLALHQFFLGLEEMAQTIRRHIPPELQPDYLARVKYRRVFSAFMYPNSLAGFLLVSFPLTLLYGALHREWFRRKNVRKLIAYVLVLPLACFVSLLLTQSKAGLLTFLVVAVACVIAGRKRLRLKPRVLLVSLLVVLIVVLGVLFSPVGRRLLVEKGRFTLGERLDYWRAGYRMFLRSPVIGNGFNSFGLLYSGYCLPGANESRSAHNNFLQVLVETGIVGFLFFIGIWFFGVAAARSAVARSLRGETPDRFSETVVLSAFIGISCFLIHSLADFDLYIPGIAMTVWLLLGLMVRNAGGAEGRPIQLGKRQAGALVFALVGVCGFGLFSAARTLNANSHLAVAQFIAESTNPPSGGAEYEEAIAEVRKAIRWDGSNHNLHLYLARLYFRMERYDEAREEYAAADRLLHGLSPMIAHRIGRTVLAEMEAGGKVEWEEVLEDFRKAVARSPSSPFHRLVYSYYLSRAGREEESRRELQEMRRLDPSGEKAFNSAVVIYRDDPFVDDLARFFEGRRDTSSPGEAPPAAEGEQ
jgi:tetratricopeptide (TPR) repeat protein